MKLNASVTLSSAELTSETIKNSTKNMFSSSVSQFKQQSKSMAEQNTTDRDTSKVLHKTKTAVAPVTTALSKSFIDNEYKKAIVKFASEYESQSAYFMNELEKDHIFLRKEFSKESPVIAEEWGSLKKTIDLNKTEGGKFFKYENYIKKGSYQISSKKELTVYDNSEINDIIRTTGLKLKRLEKQGVNGKIPVNQTEVYKKFEKMHSDALRIQKLDKKRKQKSPKRLKRQLISLVSSPISSSEGMQGYRLMEHCTTPVIAGCRFASRQANRIGYHIAKRKIAEQYIKAQPQIASHVLREDAKRYALERLRKTSSTTFFKDMATKKTLNHLEKVTAKSTSRLGKSAYNIVRLQKSLQTTPKDAIKIATKESVKSALNTTTYGRKVIQTQKKVKRTTSAAKKIATKPVRFVAKKASNTFVFRTFRKINFAVKGIKKVIIGMAKSLTKFLLSALAGFFTSVISTLVSLITMLLPMSFLLPFIAIILALGIMVSSTNGDASRYVTDSNWATVCATVKQAVAEARANDDTPYSQTESFVVNINGVDYTSRPDCSGYVSLCLRVYGSFPADSGGWISTNFVTAGELPGFKKYTLAEIGGVEGLQCGDIMAKPKSSPGANDGHVLIFDRCENGAYYIWSNGNSAAVANPVSAPAKAGVSYLLKHPTIWRCTGELHNQNNILPVTPPQNTTPSLEDTLPVSPTSPNNNPNNVLPIGP